MHFSGLCKRGTCLFDSLESVIGWNLKSTKKKTTKKTQAFLFLKLIVLMPFVPVQLFILAIKEKKNKKQKKPIESLSDPPQGSASGCSRVLISKLASRMVKF